jgi:hypothetical protein
MGQSDRAWARAVTRSDPRWPGISDTGRRNSVTHRRRSGWTWHRSTNNSCARPAYEVFGERTYVPAATARSSILTGGNASTQAACGPSLDGSDCRAPPRLWALPKHDGRIDRSARESAELKLDRFKPRLQTGRLNPQPRSRADRPAPGI